ncbi:Hypothetical predicted protein [Octopus vulgaris]|uniref:Uncharacterized protein n=1 Tax=Octopus vulgaris TaxID=6645 RepID=A0AA36AU65_OCTVU|nr:Hypothetical predicted protein [Octopus vulgaris]
MSQQIVSYGFLLRLTNCLGHRGCRCGGYECGMACVSGVRGSDSSPVESTRSASVTGTSSGAEKCLVELGVSTVAGVGAATAEPGGGDGAAAVVSQVLVVVVGLSKHDQMSLFFV